MDAQTYEDRSGRNEGLQVNVPDRSKNWLADGGPSHTTHDRPIRRYQQRAEGVATVTGLPNWERDLSGTLA